MLDKRGHLECEIEVLKLEIEQKLEGIEKLKGVLARKEQELKEMNILYNKHKHNKNLK